MKQELLARRPSPAMVVAVVALVSSLTGGAVAATLITGADIKSGTIATKDLKKNALNTKKVKNGSLLSKDFKAGQLVAGAPGPIGPAGPAGAACAPTIPECVGPKGDKGNKGDKGDTGAAGATNVVVRSQEFTTAQGNQGGGTVSCESGERATGGGWEMVSGNNGHIARHGNGPSPTFNGATPTGWRMTFFHSGPGGSDPVITRISVICASP